VSGATFGFEGLCELDAPFILKLGNAKQSRAHDGDDNGGCKSEGSLPDVFSHGPTVFADGVEGADEASTDTDADEQASNSTQPYLWLNQ